MTEKRHEKDCYSSCWFCCCVIKYADILRRRPCAKKAVLPRPARQTRVHVLCGIRRLSAMPADTVPAEIFRRWTIFL